MLFNLLQAVDTTALAPAAPVSQEMNFSLIEMATKGGWLMIVLLILSIMAIYIFGNKWWLIRKASKIDKNFMKDIHDYISRECDPDFAIGTEMLADFTAMRCDFVHIIKIQPGYENFAELFRYTFPEIPFSDRRIRDDRDIESRVNMTLIKGLINDIEIYRCRDLIDKTPHYK